MFLFRYLIVGCVDHLYDLYVLVRPLKLLRQSLHYWQQRKCKIQINNKFMLLQVELTAFYHRWAPHPAPRFMCITKTLHYCIVRVGGIGVLELSTYTL
jgi:hypothetical protein